jgi:hypothetical protein
LPWLKEWESDFGPGICPFRICPWRNIHFWTPGTKLHSTVTILMDIQNDDEASIYQSFRSWIVGMVSHLFIHELTWVCYLHGYELIHFYLTPQIPGGWWTSEASLPALFSCCGKRYLWWRTRRRRSYHDRWPCN